VTTAGYYSITPQLPQGISFNFATGAFYGTATAPSPLTNYTITVNNSFGTTTSNVAFEVAPAAGLSNGAGTTSALSNIKDGLSINMFSPDNCSKLIGIEDAAGGTELGKVQVKQTVSAIAVFNDAFFVGRVNEINAQNNNAAAVLRLFFSYQDIENYNASNGTGIDLINDTLSDMEVAVLQLHTDDRGHIEQIKHTITATWELADHHWKAEFPIDKLSKFYMGEVTSIENFNCAESDHDTVVTSAAFYVWEGDSLFTSGDYTDTLVNMNGCDSILNLNITINGGAGLVALSAFEQGISIYPNPSKGMVTIKLQGEINVESLMVFNVYGQEVYSSSNLNPTSVLDLSTIPKGIYFIQLANEDVKTVRRLVLN
ncbi:MAG: T9SS type A sorting domain-containing protein, partial [Bacteroidetes bacterium]|nr:T9SS type A sorting domain-containing protein [Bacteroidota bacterium]